MIESVADFDKRAKANAKKLESGQVQYACGCGSYSFSLLQDDLNIKAQCNHCNDIRIIAWNSTGAVLNLKTFKWQKPHVKITME